MMFVGVIVGRGVAVGAAVTVGMRIGGGVRLPLDRKVSATATRTTTAVISSIRSEGGDGSGLLAGAVVGGCTSGIAPTACMESSKVAFTWSVSSFGCKPIMVPN